jgi:hypothetical protein
MSSTADGYLPQRQLNSGNTLFNEVSFVIKQALGRTNVAMPVRVVAVYGGGTNAVGTVDVLPLVNQLDGSGSSMQHSVIYGIPYLRLQGGVNAVICDPKKGDIGFCIICDRDTSAVRASGSQANPGSHRRFDPADAVYVGGWNNSKTAPTRYLIIDDSGIKIVAPEVVEVSAPLKIIGNVEIDGNLTVTGAVTGQGTDLHTHTHSGVTAGTGTSGAPI